MIKVQNSYLLYFTTSTIFALVLVLLSCSKETGEQATPPIASIPLGIIQSFPLDILEPSGLAHGWNSDEFLVVSDNSNSVFRIHKDGSIIEELSFRGDDLEGVSYQESGKFIWLAEERLKKLVKLNKNGEVLKEYPLDYDNSSSNKGLEGVSVNTKNNHVYAINEYSPGLLLEFFDGALINSFELDFAQDYSGLYVDVEAQEIWILSDESRSIYQCDLTGKPINTYSHNIDQLEGLIVNANLKQFWVCSDSQNTLYQLKIKNL